MKRTDVRVKGRSPSPRRKEWTAPRKAEIEEEEHLTDGLQKKDGYSILGVLDERQGKLHKYKYFRNHSKSSGLSEITAIIEQLLDKHEREGPLSSSEQYIFLGYLNQYLQTAEQQPALRRNPFQLASRLGQDLYPREKLPEKGFKQKGDEKGFRQKGEEKKEEILQEFEKVKFLWQIYQLRNLVCPALSKSSEREEASTRKQLLELIGKLKAVERSRDRMSEEKALGEVGKVMRRFQAQIQSILFEF